MPDNEMKKPVGFVRLEFPEITDASIVWGGYPKDWFAAALEREAEVEQKWRDKAEHLFFEGGKIELYDGIDKSYAGRGIRMLKAVLGSFEPKYEHKEAVAGLILKSLGEP